MTVAIYHWVQTSVSVTCFEFWYESFSLKHSSSKVFYQEGHKKGECDWVNLEDPVGWVWVCDGYIWQVLLENVQTITPSGVDIMAWRCPLIESSSFLVIDFPSLLFPCSSLLLTLTSECWLPCLLELQSKWYLSVLWNGPIAHSGWNEIECLPRDPSVERLK